MIQCGGLLGSCK